MFVFPGDKRTYINTKTYALTHTLIYVHKYLHTYTHTLFKAAMKQLDYEGTYKRLALINISVGHFLKILLFITK